MKEEESQLLSIFEQRLYKAISLYNDLKLKVIELQDLNLKLKTENIKLKEQYDNLKIARIFSIKKDDFKRSKEMLSFLIKEVDECMTLLND